MDTPRRTARDLAATAAALGMCVSALTAAPDRGDDLATSIRPVNRSVGIGPNLTVRAVGEFAGGGGSDISSFGVHGDVAAWSVATTVCNRGDAPVNWYDWDGPGSPGADQHPVMIQNLYRLERGELRHIGMSWIKHGFCAVNEPGCDPRIEHCEETDCDTLGVGCADTSWSGLNAAGLGPRSEVEADGTFTYPPLLEPDGPPALRGRLQAAVDDVDPALHPEARYFVEVQYLAADDHAAGNSHDNCSTIEVAIADDDHLTMTRISPAYEGLNALHTWAAVDSTVTSIDIEIDSGSDAAHGGAYTIASRVQDLGDGFYRYDYALRNNTSTAAALGFSVPVPTCATVANPVAWAPAAHSGERITDAPWQAQVTAGAVIFTCAGEADRGERDRANAIRWGTTYGFSFDCDAPPGVDERIRRATAHLGAAARPLRLGAHIPVADCAAACSADVAPINFDGSRGDGVVNADDMFAVIHAFGSNNPHLDIAPINTDTTIGDGRVDVDDLFLVLNNFNQTCH